MPYLFSSVFFLLPAHMLHNSGKWSPTLSDGFLAGGPLVLPQTVRARCHCFVQSSIKCSSGGKKTDSFSPIRPRKGHVPISSNGLPPNLVLKTKKKR